MNVECRNFLKIGENRRNYPKLGPKNAIFRAAYIMTIIFLSSKTFSILIVVIINYFSLFIVFRIAFLSKNAIFCYFPIHLYRKYGKNKQTVSRTPGTPLRRLIFCIEVSIGIPDLRLKLLRGAFSFTLK